MLKTDPQLPTCADCQKWVYDLKTGRRTERGGVPVERPANVGPPCRVCPKVPEGMPPVPASAVELTDANLMALAHYRECRATGRWPDDERVRRNAALIRDVEDAVEATRAVAAQRLLGMIGRAMGG